MTKKHRLLRLKAQGPVRTCVICRQPRAQRRLYRLVREGADLRVERKKTLPGRGYYICRDGECLKIFLAGRRRLGRSSLTAAALDQQSLEFLRAGMDGP
ncbi:MAG: YlxR family protein [Deltaproteobacteria bacterium]|nr:YlxR family protein [Deltaproteobacteria bacterium]